MLAGNPAQLEAALCGLRAGQEPSEEAKTAAVQKIDGAEVHDDVRTSLKDGS